MRGQVIPLRRHELVEGDVVQLKSGGPLMLVGIADGEIMNDVTCLWTGGTRGRRLMSDTFDFRALELVVAGQRP